MVLHSLEKRRSSSKSIPSLMIFLGLGLAYVNDDRVEPQTGHYWLKSIANDNDGASISAEYHLLKLEHVYRGTQLALFDEP